MSDLLGTEITRIARERDLYRRLLDLGSREDVEPFLDEALALIVQMSGAERGYLELRDHGDGDGWSTGHSLSAEEVEAVRDHVSTGIVAAALASGETVVTDSALLDRRFSRQASVQAERIGAVICASIGGGERLGVVYLQAAADQGAFSDEDRQCVERFAMHLGPLADRLLVRARVRDTEDETRDLRARYALAGIVGRSRALAEVLQQGMLAAPLDVNVLITGESGTGKTQLARAIHDNSARASGPFVELNCAALPETLIESELFGAIAGAHSSAMRDASGKVAAAEGGTLFLDEIGELPHSSQAKLLQLLQARTYYPLGSAEAVAADIRVIAATNADLQSLVEAKTFREDLYFRLHVLAIHMPSLEARREDLVELAQAVSTRMIEEDRLPDLALGRSAIRAIESAEWPGNVRQLESALAAAAIRASGEGASEISARHVFPTGETDAVPNDESPLSFQEATRRFQRDLLARTLDETNWNVAETSRRLDLARSHVYRLIDSFGFSREPD